MRFLIHNNRFSLRR